MTKMLLSMCESFNLGQVVVIKYGREEFERVSQPLSRDTHFVKRGIVTVAMRDHAANPFFQHFVGSLRTLRRKLVQWRQHSVRSNLSSGGGHRVLNYPFNTGIGDCSGAERKRVTSMLVDPFNKGFERVLHRLVR